MRRLRIVLLAVAIVVLIAGIVQLGPDLAYAGGGNSGGTCPGGSGCGCSFVFAPVICGKQKCRYTNFCYAQCAGWSVTQCSDVP